MSRIIPLCEVKKHNKSRSVWIVIHNDVYDVTKFLNEHPGGAESLLEVAGRDGTQAFEDVGHSEDARSLMLRYKIGSLPVEESVVFLSPCVTRKRKEKSPTKFEPAVKTIIVPRQSYWWLYLLIALGVAAGGAFAYSKYSK